MKQLQALKLSRSTIALTCLALVCTAGFVFLVASTQDKTTDKKTTLQPTPENAVAPKSADDPYNLQITDAEAIENDTSSYTPPTDKPSALLRIDGTLFDTNNSDVRLGKWLINGNQVTVELLVGGIQASDCTLTQTITPDNPAFSSKTVTLKAVATQTATLEDGKNDFEATCKTVGKVNATYYGWDRQPEKCKDFTFTDSAITVATSNELRSGIAGTWKGCVKTPWSPMYEATITFNANGTYSSKGGESLDDMLNITGTYYGTDADNPLKTYAIEELTSDKKGRGTIDIFFENSNTTVRDSLSNIQLMGNKLSFDMIHLGAYGPLTFQLYKQ